MFTIPFSILPVEEPLYQSIQWFCQASGSDENEHFTLLLCWSRYDNLSSPLWADDSACLDTIPCARPLAERLSGVPEVFEKQAEANRE
jgi:hypothetical protein